MKIISVGCVCVDVFVEEKQILPGGESLNFCGNICGFPDTDCYLISRIGNDEYGKEILKKLSTYRVDISRLKVENGVTANHKIYHTVDGDRYFRPDSWDGGIYDSFLLDDAEIDFIKSADAVHTLVDSPVFEQVIRCKEDSNFLLAVDFNEYRDFDKWEKILPNVDLFFISGDEGIFETLKCFSARFDTVFICTLAEKGSIAFSKEKTYRCSAVPVEKVIDTTGAGDSFLAGFVREYLNSKNIDEALTSGSGCASKNIVRLGGF